MTSHFFLYIRRSDGDRNNNYQLETQINSIKLHLQDYFKLTNEEIDLIPFYKDVKVEGVTELDKRESFGKLMKDIINIRENDDITPIYIIAYRQDRISRNQSILCDLKKFISNKGVKLHYSYHNGEIKPEISTMLNIVDTFERKNTISRINAFYKAHKNDWGDPRVGFGWDFEPRSKEYPRGRKVPNPKEYPVLCEIQSLYEDGEIIVDICNKMNEDTAKKNKGKDWNSTSLKFVCEKNEMVWCKNINKEYFEDKHSDGLSIFKIKNFEKFLEDHSQIKTSSDFWQFFTDKIPGRDVMKPYYNGVKINKPFLKNYFEIDDESILTRKINNRITFWLNEDENYSLYEIRMKIIEEFGSNEKIKEWSIQTIGRKVKKIKESINT